MRCNHCQGPISVDDSRAVEQLDRVTLEHITDYCSIDCAVAEGANTAEGTILVRARPITQ